MNRYAVFYVDRFVKSYDKISDAIKCAKTLQNSYTFVDVIDSENGKVVYTWCY